MLFVFNLCEGMLSGSYMLLVETIRTLNPPARHMLPLPELLAYQAAIGLQQARGATKIQASLCSCMFGSLHMNVLALYLYTCPLAV